MWVCKAWQEFLLPTVIQELNVLLVCDTPIFKHGLSLPNGRASMEDNVGDFIVWPGSYRYITFTHIPLARTQPYGPNIPARELGKFILLCSQEKNEIDLCYIYSWSINRRTSTTLRFLMNSIMTNFLSLGNCPQHLVLKDWFLTSFHNHIITLVNSS